MIAKARERWFQIWGKWQQTKAALFFSLLWQDMSKKDLFNHAYAMAYVTLFSLIPSLAATFALISLFTPLFGENSSLIVEGRQLILKHLATGSGEQALTYLENFLSNTDFKKIGITGFAGTVVTLILLLRQIEMALNRIFEIDQPRPIFIRFVYFWTFLTLGTFSLALTVGALSSTSWGSKYLEVSVSLRILNDLIYLLGMFAFFFSLYKVVPNRYIPIKTAAWGGLVAALLFSLAVRFFSLYIGSFTKYQAFYGALAAVPIFLFWLYVIWCITLLGGAVTKRAMDGLHERDKEVKNEHPHLQAAYFQSFLPFLTLVKVYESFERDRGRGADSSSIARDLSISVSSVRKALHQLVVCELVLPSQPEVLAAAAEATFFPRLPLEQLSYLAMKERLLGNERHWIQCTHLPPSIHGNYENLIQKFFKGEDRVLAQDLRELYSRS